MESHWSVLYLLAELCILQILGMSPPSKVMIVYFSLSCYMYKSNIKNTRCNFERSQHLLPSMCFLGRMEKKMATLASDLLRHFRLLPWNRWTELNETWQECPPPILCFSGMISKTIWPPRSLIGWDIFDFSSETTEQNLTKLDRKQDSLCFLGQSENKMAARSLISWDIFSSPEPKARVSYCQSAPSVIRPSVNFSHFRLLLQNCWMDFDETW